MAARPAPGESIEPSPQPKRLTGVLALAALGIVFGDIGTSPLYTLRACFSTAHVQPTADNVFGIISLLLWTLVMVVAVKYVTIVMRVDYRGEGGILALLARLVEPNRDGVFPPLRALTLVGAVGAAALLGDGFITPAISVLSAVEGTGTIASGAARWEVPITVVILLGLFVAQTRGTQKIGVAFGPVMGLWFAAIAVAGAVSLAARPQILGAFDPRHAIWFVSHHGAFGFLVLGASILAVTGAEALYADMSHFGRRAVTVTWYGVVFPALVLNYLGQGAALLRSPGAVDDAFYALAHGWALIPMVALATAATVIASQALIAGAFTVVEQAIALNLTPRMRVVHTDNRYPGQVFVPAINVVLAVGCIGLVLAFRSSAALASAYGLAVALTMLATSILFYAVVRRTLRWHPVAAGAAFTFMLTMDGSFVASGLAKIPAGGWIPLLIAAICTLVAATWYSGHRAVLMRLAQDAVPVERFLADVARSDGRIVEGTAVFFTNNPTGVPYLLQHHWTRVQSLHERIVLLTLVPSVGPYVDEAERVTIEELGKPLVRVEARFGFMELPSLQPIVAACAAQRLQIDDASTSFVTAKPIIVKAGSGHVRGTRRWFFDVMQRLVGTLPEHLAVPPNQLVEIGIDVPL